MIKFRVWDKNKNKYAIDGEEGSLTNLLRRDDWNMMDPNDYIFEQFTGLKDMNGNKIYEGDILENQKYVSVVKFDKGKFLADVVGVINKFDLVGEIYSSKIIGNVRTKYCTKY